MYETIEGNWNKQTAGELRGDVDSTSYKASCIGGEETDTDYEVGADLTVQQGNKAAIIVFYTTEGQINYLEMALDIANTKIALNKVEAGSPTEIASVDYPLEVGETYECRVIAKSTTQIQCILNGVTVISENVTGYDEGKHGFACAGTAATDYATVFKMYTQKPEHYAHLLNVLGDIKSVNYKDIVGKDGNMQDYYDTLMLMIEECSRFIDAECNRSEQAFKDGGITLTDYKDGLGLQSQSDLSEVVANAEAQSRTFFFNERPASSVTSVHENKASIGDSDDWSEITAFRFNEDRIVLGVTPAEGFKNVRIIYVVGWTKTPLTIKQACRRLIINFINKGIGDKSASFMTFARPQAVNFASPTVYTPLIQTILKRYTLTSYGEM